MLHKLILKNFRGFSNHTIIFNPLTIVVGRNNAGKSTIVEALRIISVVVSRYRGLAYLDVPDWIEIPRRMRGVKPSIKDLNINFRTIFHRYGSPPAIVHAIFNSKEEIIVYIGPEESIHAVILDSDVNPVNTKGKAYNVKIPHIGILPQIGPLREEESILNPDYVKTSMSSSLASLHFRNQIKIFYDHFKNFKELAESSWPGLQIRSFESGSRLPHENLSLFIRDGDFVSEVGLVGHGLQMWLQTIWFLSMAKSSEIVILDEPDVYMHADLQRRLIRILKGRFKQVIIATHSIEIMAEVEASNILVVDKEKRRSRYTNTLPAVQRVIDYIGGVHNIHLARLWNAKKFLLVEGNDIQILKRLQNILYPDSHDPFDIIPHMSIGGWSGWNYVIGSSMFVKSTGTDQIKFYCILDSDYHLENEINHRYQDAVEKNIQLHIWKRKEIENYLLVPEVILRVITSRISKSSIQINIEKVTTKLEEIYNSSEIKNYILDTLANEYINQDRSIRPNTANRRARELIDNIWDDSEKRHSIIPGKKVFSILSNQLQNEYGISISSTAIASELKKDELHQEIKKVIRTIEIGDNFI
jgi:predicted ATP-dependent endonuclease of OLD family